MDKNIAALLREDARTVHVVFPYDNNAIGDGSGMPKRAGSQHPNAMIATRDMADGRPLYTYVTDIAGLKVDDYVAVTARGQFRIAQVKDVDDEVVIEPNSDITYAWVIDVVDVARWDANALRNREIEATVGSAYKARVKRSFAQEILGGVNGKAAEKLQALLAPGTKS